MKTISNPLNNSDSAKQFAIALQDERVAHLVRLCARGFSRSLSRRLAVHNVSFGQWVFLRILWSEEGLSQRQLSERANLTEPTVHTALSKMEQLGLIYRQHKEGNRRKRCVYLSERGHGLKKVLEPLAVEANNIAMAGLDASQQEAMHQMLIHVLSNLELDEVKAEAWGQQIPPTRGFAI